MVSSVRVDHLPFSQVKKKTVYREGLGRVRPHHNSKMSLKTIAIGKHIFHPDVLAENFGLTFKTFRLFRSFPAGATKLSYHFNTL